MRLCLFSSFFMSRDIPKYVQHYLIELQRHFDSIIFLNNDCKQLSDESLKWLSARNIVNYPVKNEGYDFGMWAKYMRSTGINDASELALVNDSCVQFAPLDEFINWSRNSKSGVCGLTDSNVFLSYHLQSYFLIIKKYSIKEVCTFISDSEYAQSYLEAVQKHEIGLSGNLMKKRHSLDSFFSVKETGYDRDLMMMPVDLINDGLPMIKKKLIYSSEKYKQAVIILHSQGKNLDVTRALKKAQFMCQIDDRIMNELFDFNAILSVENSLKLSMKERLVIFKRKYFNFVLGNHRYDQSALKYRKN